MRTKKSDEKQIAATKKTSEKAAPPDDVEEQKEGRGAAPEVAAPDGDNHDVGESAPSPAVAVSIAELKRRLAGALNDSLAILDGQRNDGDQFIRSLKSVADVTTVYARITQDELESQVAELKEFAQRARESIYSEKTARLRERELLVDLVGRLRMQVENLGARPCADVRVKEEGLEIINA